MNSLTGKYRYRFQKRWWTAIPLLVLQVEDSYNASINGKFGNVRYWRDALPTDIVKEISWECANHEGVTA